MATEAIGQGLEEGSEETNKHLVQESLSVCQWWRQGKDMLAYRISIVHMIMNTIILYISMELISGLIYHLCSKFS